MSYIYAEENAQKLSMTLRNVLSCIEMDEEKTFVTYCDLFEDLLKSHVTPTQPLDFIIENNYTGLHLGEFELQDFHRLVEYFSNQGTLHQAYVLKIIKRAKEILKTLPNIQKCYVNGPSDNVVIVGDLHGNFRDLKYLIDKYGAPGDRYQFVFNGDFVDRGEQQIEVALTILYAFILNPSRVFLNRGNHEDESLNTSSNFSPNFVSDIKKKYHTSDTAWAIFDAMRRLFSWLPIATSVKNKESVKIFVVHGGISRKTDLDYVQNSILRGRFRRISSKDNDPTQSAALSELMWSDPIRFSDGRYRPKEVQSLNGCFKNTARKIGCYFGEDVTRDFCDNYRFSFIVRSHEVCYNGYVKDHDRCFTVFSASNYCNGHNKAAVLLFGYNSKEIIPDVFSTSGDVNPNALFAELNSLIEKFKRVLIRNQKALLEAFRKADPFEQGFLSISQWASIMCHFFSDFDEDDIISLKDHLCVCDDSLNQVKYLTMFSTASRDEEFLEQLRNIFNLMDYNKNGKISFMEARQAISCIAGVYDDRKDMKYMQLIKDMDKNRDSEIDFEEFKNAMLHL